MLDTKEVKNKILAIMSIKGPCLPVQLARELKIESLFASAFLSELAHEKLIKISNLKVGGSPLYFITGQEQMLENFKQYLAQKEQEALSLLKNKQILRDSEQDPVIRVALRSIKDFAIAFKNDNETYWRYMLVSEPEVRNLFNKTHPIEIQNEVKVETIKINPIKEPDKIIEPEQVNVQEQVSQIIPSKPQKEVEITKEIQLVPQAQKQKKPKIQKQKNSPEIKPLHEFKNPLTMQIQEPPKKEKPKSDFVIKAIEYINKNFRLIQEKDYKNKEYTAIVQVNSQLGPINFLTQVKDKKSLTESDLADFLAIAQTIPLPALVLYTGDLSKKAYAYQEQYFSILKTKKLE